MLRKIFLLLLVVTAVFGVSAQHAPGSWKVLPMSGMDFDDVLDTPEKVYYLTGNALYAYDKEADETIYYTPGSKISDSGIQSIAYNKVGKYLLCAYTNGNIDLIYDSGKVVNLPEIKDANLVVEKGINDIAFDDNRIYVATTFGIVIYDDQKHVVVESAIFNEPVFRIAILGDNMVIIKQDSTYNLYYSPKLGRHNSMDKFTKIYDSVGRNEIYSVGDDSYLTLGTNAVRKCTVNFTSGGISVKNLEGTFPGVKRIQTYKDGYFVVSDNGVTLIGQDGTKGETTAIPSDFVKQKLSFWNNLKSVWAGDSNGLGNYDLGGSTATVLRDKYYPESSKQFNNCFYTDTPDGSEVYFNGIGQSAFHPSSPSDEYTTPLLIESYNWNDGTITPLYPNVTSQYSSMTQNIQNSTHLNLLYGGTGNCLVDPVNPSLVYVANQFDGLMILKDRKIVKRFYEKNSPLFSGWNYRIFYLSFDTFGNLWIGIWNILSSPVTSNGFTHPRGPYVVLKKEGLDKLRANVDADLVQADWSTTAFPENDGGNVDPKLIFSSKTGKALNFYGNFSGRIYGYDTKGTSQTTDDKCVVYTGFTDQDGNTSNPTNKSWLVEDKNGDFWIGTTTGVYVLKDFDQIADGSSTTLNTIRPKVARNDGTNYADYLLSSDQVLCIAVDCNNNKWIATSASGLYQVNEDGTEILAEFNKDNSPLVSNCITMVACNPNGNDVLIGTPEGLFVYSSDSAPAQDDYSSVYAYPNPVRPDYTGWITINGLMDNSLVKITDAQGHVVWQSKSEGGMAIWDGCDASGNRVRSGVYMVYASQNASGDSSGAVTKIVVIN